MEYKEAIALAQEEANRDGYNRLVYPFENGFEVMDQVFDAPKDSEVIYAEEKCDSCGKLSSELDRDEHLHYYEEEGEGWDHLREGTFCNRCRINMVGDI